MMETSLGSLYVAIGRNIYPIKKELQKHKHWVDKNKARKYLIMWWI